MRLRHFAVALFALLIAGHGDHGVAQQAAQQADYTPPRLAYMEGQVSFWRPGAQDWVSARLNTPLAAGDELYTGDRSNVELQVGMRAFVRGDEQTEFGLVNQEANFLQFKVTAGLVSLDLRNFPEEHVVEVDTPNAAFTIKHAGYYRVEIMGDTTHFITRRDGQATAVLPGGRLESISPSEETVVRGTSVPITETYVAPELDTWDRWNYARTDHYMEAVSARYISPDVYGADSLDSYGSWRDVQTYGPVWVPDGVPSDWAPYTTGSWIWDPYYGWTWIDDAAWGWAPFHYGRWVFTGGFWAWAPGPVVARPLYAPALVAFFSIGGNTSVRIGIGEPSVCWVALGWGEPVIPWWGRHGFIGVPHWRGWGGPHLINNRVVSRTASINVNNITFQNATISNAVVIVHSNEFGRGSIRTNRIRKPLPFRQLRESRELATISGALPIKPGAQSLPSGGSAAIRPQPAVNSRRVFATRPSHEPKLPGNLVRPEEKPVVRFPESHIITLPRHPAVVSRPPFGRETGPERARPSPLPRLEELRRPEAGAMALPSRQGISVGGERAPARSFAPRPAPEIAAPRGQQEREIQRPFRSESRGPVLQSIVPQRQATQPGMERHPREERSLPGRPANQLFQRQGKRSEEKAHETGGSMRRQP